MANCFYHEEKNAVARCSVCGKSVCEECLKQEGSMTFCSDDCKSKAAATTQRSNDVLTEKSRTASATLVRKLIYIFVVIAAVAAAWYFYDQHQKKVDRKFNRSVKQIQKSGSKLLKNLPSLPKSGK